jgi:thioredoxin 1
MTFKEMINSDKPVLVDFFAEWCGPCKTMAPVLKQVKDEVQESASIIKIDIDKNQQTAAVYNISAVPTLLLFKNGRVVWRQSGVVPKTELIKKIKEQL